MSPKKFQICSLIAKVSLTIVKCPQKPNLWTLCHFKAQELSNYVGYRAEIFEFLKGNAGLFKF